MRAAEARGTPVLAVPGPVRSPASSGTNRLIADGCVPACDVQDVLVALSLERSTAPPPADPRPAPSATEAAVLGHLGWQPVPLEELLARTGLGAPAVATALAHLEQDGWARGSGGWWERVAAP